MNTLVKVLGIKYNIHHMPPTGSGRERPLKEWKPNLRIFQWLF
jgi:hypothetical protein